MTTHLFLVRRLHAAVGILRTLIFVRHVFTEEAAFALGNNRVRWPRC